MRPTFEFRVTKVIPLADLKSKLENLLHYTDNQRVTKIDYRSSTINNKEKIKFGKFELKRDACVRVIWISFHRYTTKGPIEVDVSLSRSSMHILKMMKRLNHLLVMKCQVIFRLTNIYVMYFVYVITKVKLRYFTFFVWFCWCIICL